jgi:hypothetical protein
MRPYSWLSDELLLGFDGLDGLNAQAIWHQCDVACAENGTFSLAETQRFGPPDIVHNMRGSGLSTAAPDERPARRGGSFPPILTRLPRFEGT